MAVSLSATKISFLRESLLRASSVFLLVYIFTLTMQHLCCVHAAAVYLCPCHNFNLPACSIPGHKCYHKESGDSSKIASVEEGVGDAQESSTETEVHHKEKPKKDVHRFWSLDLPFLPGPLPRHHYSSWSAHQTSNGIHYFPSSW